MHVNVASVPRVRRRRRLREERVRVVARTGEGSRGVQQRGGLRSVTAVAAVTAEKLSSNFNHMRGGTLTPYGENQS